jgi:hypothetical protein
MTVFRDAGRGQAETTVQYIQGAYIYQFVTAPVLGVYFVLFCYQKCFVSLPIFRFASKQNKISVFSLCFASKRNKIKIFSLLFTSLGKDLKN